MSESDVDGGPSRPPFRNVLVRIPNWVGDLVMSTVALRALRNGLPPEARITLLGKRSGHLLLKGSPWFDDFIVIGRETAGVGGALRLGKELRSRRFDLALLFPNSFSSACHAMLGRIPRRVGHALNGRRLLLTDAIRPAMEGRRRVPRYMGEYYLDLLALVGVPRDGRPPELHVTADEAARWREHRRTLGFAEDEPFVALNPGASFGPSKLWSTERFAETGDRLCRTTGLRSLVLCGPGEEDVAREVEDAMTTDPIGTSSPGRMIPLDLLKPCLREARLLVTTDSGPRHLAVAFDRPVVVLMGSTDPRYTDAFLDRTRVLRVDVPCGPCHLKTCPLDHRCMTALTPEMAVAAGLGLLGEA